MYNYMNYAVRNTVQTQFVVIIGHQKVIPPHPEKNHGYGTARVSFQNSKSLTNKIR